MSTTTLPPNPSTPMAWVPPDLARKLTVQLYVADGSLGVLVWDIILHGPQDYAMLRKERLNVTSVAYIIARLSGLAYVSSQVIVQTAPIRHCDHIGPVSFLYVVAMPFTALLLVFRATNLYKGNKYAIAFFVLSWLVVLATSIVVPMGVIGKQIQNTRYCTETMAKPHAIIGAITPFIHNTLIFLATTWCFVKKSYKKSNSKNSFDILALGEHLPVFSSFLRHGQCYLLATIIFNLFSVTLHFIRQSFIFPSTFSLPIFVLINTMSCHLYRNRLGYQDCTNTEVFRGALEGFPSSDQQHQLGIAFSPGRSRHSTHLTQVDLEAAREDSNSGSREKVDVVGLDKAESLSGSSKENITEKAEL